MTDDVPPDMPPDMAPETPPDMPPDMPPDTAPDTPPDVPPDMAPDTKDWTWVLERPCPACGFDCSALDRYALPGLIRAAVAPWRDVLRRPDAAVRPDPATWSPLEYACHVRDVCRVFSTRVLLMREQDNPGFDNWDQDRTAVTERYFAQDPARVSAEVVVAGEQAAQAFSGVTGAEWDRRGRRSNGSEFTIDTLGRYFLHDLRHHVRDVD